MSGSDTREQRLALALERKAAELAELAGAFAETPAVAAQAPVCALEVAALATSVLALFDELGRERGSALRRHSFLIGNDSSLSTEVIAAQHHQPHNAQAGGGMGADAMPAAGAPREAVTP